MPPSTLIIDDDIRILDSLWRLTQLKGFEIATATTWEEGIAAFQAISPKLVVSDHNLSGSRNGTELLTEMGRLNPSARLILLTGDVEAIRHLEAGNGDVIHRVLLKGGSGFDQLLEEIAQNS